jgi:hypothetical protein
MSHEQPNDPATRAATSEWLVLDLLLHEDTQQLWSADELARELGSQLGTHDAIDNLYGAGLIHRTSDGFVFLTRAAAHFHEIAQ